jgi:hypothetical protein
MPLPMRPKPMNPILCISSPVEYLTLFHSEAWLESVCAAQSMHRFA